jgi:hypothetical protein
MREGSYHAFVSRANLAEGHPTKEDLERFMRGELFEQQPRTIVRHLLTGCRQCRRVTRRLWGPVYPKEPPDEGEPGHER